MSAFDEDRLQLTPTLTKVASNEDLFGTPMKKLPLLGGGIPVYKGPQFYSMATPRDNWPEVYAMYTPRVDGVEDTVQIPSPFATPRFHAADLRAGVPQLQIPCPPFSKLVPWTPRCSENLHSAVKERAYYLYLNTGSTDEVRNYFEAMEIELRQRRLDGRLPADQMILVNAAGALAI
mmetsp:Transcript_77215/g.176932  ORF Transcript_77215/g.176932 Transcript_77215/m.176932 type:complete len:177 (+) Transcript_77215:57-587(+)